MMTRAQVEVCLGINFYGSIVVLPDIKEQLLVHDAALRQQLEEQDKLKDRIAFLENRLVERTNERDQLRTELAAMKSAHLIKVNEYGDRIVDLQRQLAEAQARIIELTPKP